MVHPTLAPTLRDSAPRQPIEVRPAETSLRLLAFDLARFVAIVGMVIIDVVYNGCIDRRTGRFIDDGPSLLHVPTLIWDGRASALFVLLAGAGIVLLAKGAGGATLDSERLRSVRRTVLRRAVFLFVVGQLLQASTYWYASVLHYYALFLGAGLLFVTAGPRLLMVLALLVMPAVSLTLCNSLDYFWDYDHMRGYYRAGSILEPEFWSVGGQVSNWFFNGFFPAFPWFGFVLLGIWVARLPLRDRALRRRLLLGAAIVLVVSVGIGAVAYTLPDGRLRAALSLFRMPPMPLFVVSAAAQAVLVIGLCFEVLERWPGPAWTRALVATGQMSFTVYLVHIALGGGWRPGALDVLHFPPGMEPGYVRGWLRVLLIVPLLVVCCWLWKKRFRHGPLEALMRRIAG
jgi:uncharacterized membrane protein YeiB